MCDVAKMHIHKKCKHKDDPITVYLIFEESRIGLCSHCWAKIADSDVEWGSASKPKNFQKFLEKGRGLENATLTEYKIKGKKDDEGEEKIEAELE